MVILVRLESIALRRSADLYRSGTTVIGQCEKYPLLAGINRETAASMNADSSMLKKR